MSTPVKIIITLLVIIIGCLGYVISLATQLEVDLINESAQWMINGATPQCE